MPIHHHLDDATLMSFAAGTLPAPLAAVAACHIDLCPTCQRELRLMTRIGGAMLTALTAEPASGALASPTLMPPLLTPPLAVRRRETAAGLSADMPRPIRHLAGERIDDIPWRRLGPGVWHHPLPLAAGTHGVLALLKVAAGRVMPEHGHGGTELTLVLSGAYRDAFGRFGAGDVADLGDEVEHQPVADEHEGCICLVASDRKARFKGLASRLLQPLTGL
jgi:putative transcriptional regulator